MFLGCATNCLPAALPTRFAFVVAAYSVGDKALIAFSGKYRSPVLLDGFPDLVRHFWSPQSLRDFWGAFIILEQIYGLVMIAKNEVARLPSSATYTRRLK